jgi:hypothetical protein
MQTAGGGRVISFAINIIERQNTYSSVAIATKKSKS